METFILKRKTFSTAEKLMLGAGLFGGVSAGGYIGNKLGKKAAKNNARQKAEEDFNPEVEIKKHELQADDFRHQARDLKKQAKNPKCRYPDTKLEEAEDYELTADEHTKKANEIRKNPESARKAAGEMAYNTGRDPETESKYTKKGIIGGGIIGSGLGLAAALRYGLKRK